MINRIVRFLVVPLLGLCLGGLALSPLMVGTPAYTEREKKECVYCHTLKGKPDLNDLGKCYKDHDHSLRL